MRKILQVIVLTLLLSSGIGLSSGNCNAKVEESRKISLTLPGIQSISLPVNWQGAGRTEYPSYDNSHRYFSVRFHDNKGRDFIITYQTPDEVHRFATKKFALSSQELAKNELALEFTKHLLAMPPHLLTEEEIHKLGNPERSLVEGAAKTELLNKRPVIVTQKPTHEICKHHWPGDPPVTYESSYYMYTLIGKGTLSFWYHGSVGSLDSNEWDIILHSIEWSAGNLDSNKWDKILHSIEYPKN